MAFWVQKPFGILKKWAPLKSSYLHVRNLYSQLTLTMSCDANPPWQLLLEGIPSITPGQGLYVSLDQQRPLLVFITLAIISGSSPKRIPRFVASETPIMLTASNRLLQILAAYKIIILNNIFRFNNRSIYNAQIKKNVLKCFLHQFDKRKKINLTRCDLHLGIKTLLQFQHFLDKIENKLPHDNNTSLSFSGLTN